MEEANIESDAAKLAESAEPPAAEATVAESAEPPAAEATVAESELRWILLQAEDTKGAP